MPKKLLIHYNYDETKGLNPTGISGLGLKELYVLQSALETCFGVLSCLRWFDDRDA